MKLNVSGIDAIVEDMKRMHQLSGEAAKAVLYAGGNELQRAWIDEAQRRNHIRSGDMLKSIGQTRIRTIEGGLRLDVYPQGNSRPRGKKNVKTKNAVKAFVLHYGREGKRPIKGDKWVEKLLENSTGKTNSAMADTWGKFVQTGTVPNVTQLKKGKK